MSLRLSIWVWGHPLLVYIEKSGWLGLGAGVWFSSMCMFRAMSDRNGFPQWGQECGCIPMSGLVLCFLVDSFVSMPGPPHTLHLGADFRCWLAILGT